MKASYIYKITTLLLAFLLLSSCKKKDEDIKYTFNIAVTDYYSSAPISGVSVSAYTRGISSGVYSNTYQLQASQVSGSEGFALLEVPYSSYESIKIALEKEGYYSQSLEYNPDDFSTEGQNELSLQLKQKGVISIRIKNTSPFSAFDEITFNTINPDCAECAKFNSINLSGTNVDTTLTGSIVMNRYYKYQYIVTKNSVSTNYTDSTFCSSDTTFININY